VKLLALAFGVILAVGAVSFRYFDPAKPHRAADGFRNNYPHAEKGGFWRWKWDQLREGLPRDPEGGYRFETAKPQLGANPSVTWVGHLAAIPIGAYAPRWFMQIMHLDPAEAVQVHKDVRARRLLAMHWGTFANLTDESLDEPPLRLAEERKKAGLAADDFLVLRHGETRVLR